LRTDKVGYPLEARQEAVRPDAEIAVADAAPFLNGRSFGKYQAHAAERELAQMHQMPIISITIYGTILAHGRQHHAVAKCGAGNLQRRKQKRHLLHAPVSFVEGRLIAMMLNRTLSRPITF
jgi:hypothetical protein